MDLQAAIAIRAPDAPLALSAAHDAGSSGPGGGGPRRQRPLPLQPLDTGGGAARHSAVYDALREALMDGRLAPGTILTIRKVASSLGTSTMPVREALHRLAAHGALESLPNRSYRLILMSRETWHQTLEIRLQLECLAVRRAAGMLSPGQLAQLDEITAEMAARPPPDPQRYLTLNRNFHFVIYEATGMPVLVELIGMIWLRVGPLLHACSSPYDIATANECHATILKALRKGDGETAAAALREDLLTANRVLLPGLNVSEPASGTEDR
ncbi:GntR family transcriptional regulator [Marinimicrococcus flavescens]|uniref:GntR family transcriptional regulator n=1 Tax=Marinimicrococcus flavescens TaxID=3031815 RepID=A0AAP4D6I3_9PROT|nr:GntR family transcriptional regulator [Marinimicrococcus flavescens]